MALSGLWLPPSAQDEKPRTYRCLSCEREWPAHQRSAWERHVPGCAERNEAEALAYVEAQESSIFTSVGDKERFAFIRKRGPRKALRRRKQTAPRGTN